MANDSDRLLTLRDVALQLNVSLRSVHNMITAGPKRPRPLPTIRLGTAVRVSQRDLDAYVRSHRSDR